jgi:hypothetical protein
MFVILQQSFVPVFVSAYTNPLLQRVSSCHTNAWKNKCLFFVCLVKLYHTETHCK